MAAWERMDWNNPLWLGLSSTSASGHYEQHERGGGRGEGGGGAINANASHNNYGELEIRDLVTGIHPNTQGIIRIHLY